MYYTFNGSYVYAVYFALKDGEMWTMFRQIGFQTGISNIIIGISSEKAAVSVGVFGPANL